MAAPRHPHARDFDWSNHLGCAVFLRDGLGTPKGPGRQRPLGRGQYIGGRGPVTDENQAPTKRQRLSGAQYRRARREREKAARLAQQQRDRQLRDRLLGRMPSWVPSPPERAHLQALAILSRQLCDVANDDAISEKDRRDQICKTAHAMARLKVEAEVQREAEALADEVRQAKSRMKEERQQWLAQSQLSLLRQVTRIIDKAHTDPKYAGMLRAVRDLIAASLPPFDASSTTGSP